MTSQTRSNWTPAEVAELYGQPLMDLLHQAHTLHRTHHDPSKVQVSALLSIKTGGCPEDCGYCPQSAHHDAGVESEPLMEVDDVVRAATRAKAGGATRFCMGAAWRSARSGPQFDQVLEMVRRVDALGMETCVTLGMLEPGQARQLKEAGLHAYNHNLDTSEKFYNQIISTRTYQDRLDTIQHVRDAGITVCTGGIIGMGESDQDRVELLHRLATLEPHPESVTINGLIPVPGTPLGGQTPADPLALTRVIATARLLMPASLVRLSAGRSNLSPEAHLLCFYAGANSIFAGDRLLTAPNPGPGKDDALLKSLGMSAQTLEGAESSHG